MEVVSATSTHQEKHIEALEKRVDALVEEVSALHKQLANKSSTVTQEAYDDLCHKYQMEINKSLPF